MKKLMVSLILLWKYLSIYFLKPFDAVNDTLTAMLLKRLNWNGKVVEIGAGDGEFSYIMHGGKFPLWYDRFLQVDISRKDIFSAYESVNFSDNLPIPAHPHYAISIDERFFHTKKIKHIGFAKLPLCANYEYLPIRSNTVETVFYYIPHGLKDHKKAIIEVRRILVDGGNLLILLYNISFKDYFLCYRLWKKMEIKWLKSFFLSLDNGRFEELTSLAKTLDEWKHFFKDNGFELEKTYCGLTRIAWAFYDIQTRPFLRPLIFFFNSLPLPIRTFFKFMWIALWYPIIVIFYILFSNDILKTDPQNCYLAFQFKKRG